MTRILRGKPITGYQATAGTVVQDIRLEQCEIFGCRVEISPDPRRRPLFRDVAVVDAAVSPAELGAAAIEESTVQNVRTFGELLRVEGCVFRHVTIRGDLEMAIIDNRIDPRYPPGLASVYERANAEYYAELEASGEWALDISEASGSFEIRGIPASVIRRDPETQIVMTFEQALTTDWASLSVPGASSVLGQIHLLLSNGWRDVVLIAQRGTKDFKQDLKILRKVQAMGAALPD